MLQELLNRGTWTRPSDKMAIYTEIEKGDEWGIRVTLCPDCAIVEAIKGKKCAWYQPPEELRCEVRYPTLWERLRKITFQDKVMRAVEAKRQLARRENERIRAGKRGGPYDRYLDRTSPSEDESVPGAKQLSEAIRLKKRSRQLKNRHNQTDSSAKEAGDGGAAAKSKYR